MKIFWKNAVQFSKVYILSKANTQQIKGGNADTSSESNESSATPDDIVIEDLNQI